MFDERNYLKDGNDVTKHQSKEIISTYFLEKDEENKNRKKFFIINFKLSLVVDAKIIDKDYYCNFESQVADSTILENLTKINPEILQIENKTFAHYCNIKVLFLSIEGELKTF